MRKRWTLTYSLRHPQSPQNKISQTPPEPKQQNREQYFKSNIDSPTLGYQATHEIAKLSHPMRKNNNNKYFEYF